MSIKPVSKFIQIIPTFLLMLTCMPGAYADMPPPQAEAAPASFAIAGILVAVATVLTGLWLVARMKRIAKEKELQQKATSFSSADEAASKAVK